MNTNEVRAKFDYWFGGNTLSESKTKTVSKTAEKPAAKPPVDKKELTERKMQTSTKQKCPDCKKPMTKCECENAKKADKSKSKKGKNKMDVMPAAAKPMATKNAAMNAKKGKSGKTGKKHISEAAAKVVYGIKEGQEVKRYAIEKADLASALASAKRMAKTKDLSTVSFIDVIDLKENVVKTIYETLENYKTRKRIFETHVLCSECGSGELELSKHRTKIRCKRCKTEDLIENIDGVKKS